jgi:hypothetical protein
VRWADASVLVRPAATYRELSRTHARASPLARALWFLLVVGSTVSLLTSGRVTARLIADGMLSFAFLPVCCLAGFATTYFGRREPPLTFARALDLFMTGLLPWILWLIVLAAVCSLVRPRAIGPLIWPLEVSLAVPALWSFVVDFHFFREAMGRTAGAAFRDLLLYRLVAWGGATTYFLGIAIWYEVVPELIRWITA